jgi:hypothetical protein
MRVAVITIKRGSGGTSAASLYWRRSWLTMAPYVKQKSSALTFSILL